MGLPVQITPITLVQRSDDVRHDPGNSVCPGRVVSRGSGRARRGPKNTDLIEMRVTGWISTQLSAIQNAICGAMNAVRYI